jgi:hypothetical protein
MHRTRILRQAIVAIALSVGVAASAFGQHGGHGSGHISTHSASHGSTHSRYRATTPHGSTAAAPRTTRIHASPAPGARDARGRLERSAKAKDDFMRSTGHLHGWRGHVVDHIVPLACGGADAPSNMQWQTTAEGKAKDKVERKGCPR